MSNQEHIRVVDELRDHWGFRPNGRCYCGCGNKTGVYFASGHDSRFASSLLAALRGDASVEQAIQRLVERSLGQNSI